ncbi:hypothetical protein PFISCL1PPCAC_7688, partial [Pristionchus fissidentatus]
LFSVQLFALVSLISVVVSYGSLARLTYRDPLLKQAYFPFTCQFVVNSLLYAFYVVDYSMYHFASDFWLDDERQDSIFCDLFAFTSSFLAVAETSSVLALSIYCLTEKYELLRRVAAVVLSAIMGVISFTFIVLYIRATELIRHGCFRFNDFVQLANTVHEWIMFGNGAFLLIILICMPLERFERVKLLLLSIAVIVEFPMLISNRFEVDNIDSIRFSPYFGPLSSAVHALLQQTFAGAFFFVVHKFRTEISYDNPMAMDDIPEQSEKHPLGAMPRTSLVA